MATMADKKYDVIIIGAGVVGSMVARFLSRYKLDILLIEKDSDIGMGASSANTAIIHAGYDPKPGTLKAEMNVVGNQMFDQLAGELNFTFERRGDYVVAIGPEEEFAKLESLRQQGLENGVPGMVILKAGLRPEFKITPRKGEYYVFDKAEITINNVLFPVPSATSKGILVTTTVHGNTIIGPNALEIDDKEDRSITREGLDEIW